MSKQKKCIFVADRDCPFMEPNIPFETRQVCIEAWKTELEIKKKQSMGDQASNMVHQEGISTPVLDGYKIACIAAEKD